MNPTITIGKIGAAALFILALAGAHDIWHMRHTPPPIVEPVTAAPEPVTAAPEPVQPPAVAPPVVAPKPAIAAPKPAIAAPKPAPRRPHAKRKPHARSASAGELPAGYTCADVRLAANTVGRSELESRARAKGATEANIRAGRRCFN